MYLKPVLSKILKSTVVLLSVLISTNITVLSSLAMGDLSIKTYSDCEVIDKGTKDIDVEDGSTELTELKGDEDIGDLITKYFFGVSDIPEYILEYIMVGN